MSDRAGKAVEDAEPSLPGVGLLLMFTVDTECSVLRQPNPNPDRVVDELIFGDFGDGRRSAGIGLHMDILEQFGFRGCFFVDMMMEHRYGPSALERTVEAILERGHEVQLHLHTDQLAMLARDPEVRSLDGAIGSPDVGRFRRALELSVDLFERRVGRRPIAYRAGGFRIADAHFPVLEELGIRIDSSICPDDRRSRVADWMRTRTQPFWVGGVLEVPPTQLLVADRPDAWKLRGFVSKEGIGDPVSSMPVDPTGRPLAATYISHSFQFLRRSDTREPEEIAVFMERLRAALPADIAERLRAWSPRMVRSFGEGIDDSLVTAATAVLRHIADRPDARCATYTELVAAIDDFWPVERHPPADPIPLLDRRREASGVSATRIYSRDLLSRLIVATPEPPLGRDGSDGGKDWIEGLERCAPNKFGDRVDSAAVGIGPDGLSRLRLRTLGVAAPEQRGKLPPLAELLFPESIVQAVADEAGAEEVEAVPWDAPTFVAWLEGRGYDVVSERRVARDPVELSECVPFAEKLKWLDALELRAEAVEIVLRCSRSSAPAVTSGVDPVSLPAAAAKLYEETQPGHEASFAIPSDPAPASETTILLALVRAGFEVLEREDLGYRLIRPLELSDLRRFAGLEE